VSVARQCLHSAVLQAQLRGALRRAGVAPCRGAASLAP
jgi:hypothetical protein